MIMVYEQDLPKMTDEEYAKWFEHSSLQDGVRMGPDTTKLVIGGADDGCSDLYCIKCKNRFQARYLFITYCPCCGRLAVAFISRNVKEYYPSIKSNSPIEELCFEIVEVSPDGAEKVVESCSKPWKDSRKWAVECLNKHREDEQEMLEIGFHDEPNTFYIRKREKKHYEK